MTEHCGHDGTPELNDAGTMETSHHCLAFRSVTLTSHDTWVPLVNVCFGANHPVE